MCEAAYKKGIHPSGDKRKRVYYENYLNRCMEAGLQVSAAFPGNAGDSPAANEGEHLSQPKSAQVSHQSSAISHQSDRAGDRIDAPSRDSFENQGSNHANTGGIEAKGEDEAASDFGLLADRAHPAQSHGVGRDRKNEGLAVQGSDRVLEVQGDGSGDCRGTLPRQQPKLAPRAFNDEQRPPNRGDGKRKSELAIGMNVGRRQDWRPLGTVRDIYTKNGRVRAKIGPHDKGTHFVYFDCDKLIEQKLVFDGDPEPIGPWQKTDRTACKYGSICEVWVKKSTPKVTSWTVEQLSQLSISKLKKIARDMQIYSIPGTAWKRSLMRAILAEQAIAAEGCHVEFPQRPAAPTKPVQKVPNPKLYYWLNTEHREAAGAIERIGWEFHQPVWDAEDLHLACRFKGWEFYTVTGEPLILATVGGATFQLDCNSISNWKAEITKAKRAIGEAVRSVQDSIAPAAKQLSFLELLAV